MVVSLLFIYINLCSLYFDSAVLLLHAAHQTFCTTYCLDTRSDLIAYHYIAILPLQERISTPRSLLADVRTLRETKQNKTKTTLNGCVVHGPTRLSPSTASLQLHFHILMPQPTASFYLFHSLLLFIYLGQVRTHTSPPPPPPLLSFNVNTYTCTLIHVYYSCS